MSRILLLYRSTHGHTAKVARAIAGALGAEGVSVDVLEAGRSAPAPDGYDGVIVAASVHGGKYQKQIVRWTRTHAAVLNRKPAAFVSVCLAVLQQEAEVREAVEGIVRTFIQATGWRPMVVKHVAGALAYTRYNWFVRRMMKRIAAQAHGDTDTTRDHVYTDWDDLTAFAREFAHRITTQQLSLEAIGRPIAS